MALGADAAGCRALVMRQVGVMMIVGSVIGIAAAVGLAARRAVCCTDSKGTTRWCSPSSVLVLMLVALGAGYIPARRASPGRSIQAARSGRAPSPPLRNLGSGAAALDSGE